MKETPFLDFYFECMRTGLLPRNGLCWSLGNHIEFVELFNPGWPPDEMQMGYVWGFDGTRRVYSQYDFDGNRKFTPLRQTIVLFCAAINGEL